MSTGAAFYPGASTAYRYDAKYPGVMQEINCCVTHTTEGTSLPDYDGGVSAPNVTILPDIPNKRIKVYAHFPADMSARALVDDPKTEVRTNRNNCHQVELVGSCDPARRASWGKLRAGVDYIYWPDAPDWLLRAYAGYIAWLHTEHGVPLVSTPRPWLAYPGSYGNSKARMGLDEWHAFKGHCGHMHVPDGNDHGDPGNTRMDLVIGYAKTLASGETPDPSEEDDMPTPQEYANAVWAHQETNVATGRPVSMAAVMTWMDKVHNTQNEIFTRQNAATQAAITALATLLGQHDDVDTDTVIAAVKAAIADAVPAALAEAVIDVDVTVHGTPATKES
ncbi:hypothetical protein ABT024_06800 [Streptomyces sp. NPDC002812]|uniref:hypothetical protein n=1 Tax=Streptomyces sp. NPDC002812 TaxID=3154434 RepID=UPI00331A0C48